MQRGEQLRAIKELLAKIDSGTTVDAGGLRVNPTSVYVDPDLASREWDEFFRNHPQLVGLSGDLPEPGSFLTTADFGTPILAVRDEAGRFRAFVNACRHRGAVIESEVRGRRRRFTCPFHAWTYSADGRLVGLPKRDHFGEVDTEGLGLVELPAAERYGLLWVHPDPDGEIDVDALLTPALAEELDAWDLTGLQHLDGDSYDVACNWKLAMDTFGETYHFPVLHQNTINLGFRGNVQCYAGIIRDEDYVMSASQQVTASSGALSHVIFGRNEPALHHYHSTYRAALGLDPLPLLAEHELPT